MGKIQAAKESLRSVYNIDGEMDSCNFSFEATLFFYFYF